MQLQSFTPFSALAGGALIGLAATLLLLTHGRVAGISGIVAELVGGEPRGRPFRVGFVAGLAAAGVAAAVLVPQSIGVASAPLAQIACAGLLVGFGSRLGNGCTSGHGVCGLSRGSLRSLVATLVFMATGFATVFMARHVLP